MKLSSLKRPVCYIQLSRTLSVSGCHDSGSLGPDEAMFQYDYLSIESETSLGRTYSEAVLVFLLKVNGYAFAFSNLVANCTSDPQTSFSRKMLVEFVGCRMHRLVSENQYRLRIVYCLL